MAVFGEDPWILHFVRLVSVLVLWVAGFMTLVVPAIWGPSIMETTGFQRNDFWRSILPGNQWMFWTGLWRYTARTRYWVEGGAEGPPISPLVMRLMMVAALVIVVLSQL